MAEEVVSSYRIKFSEDSLKSIRRISNAAKTLTRSFGALTAGVAAYRIALGASLNNVNQMTAQQSRLADSVGVSFEQLSDLSGIAKQIGLDFDNVVDLAEEMNNKVGEMKSLGDFKTLDEALMGIGLRFADINKLSPDEQFNKIFDAASRVGDIQVAQSSLDMLMGSEASKISGRLLQQLRRTGQTYSEFRKEQAELNNLTADGRKGAEQYTQSIAKLSKFVSTLTQQGFGKLGEAMSPTIDRFTEFLLTNKEVINLRVQEWAQDLGASFREIDFKEVAKSAVEIGKGIGKLVAGANKLAESFGGWGNVLKAIVGLAIVSKVAGLVAAFAAIVPVVTAVGGVIASVVAIIGGPLIAAIGAAVAAGALIYKNWERIKDAFDVAYHAAGRLALMVSDKFGFIPHVAGVNAMIDVYKGLTGESEETLGALGKVASRLRGSYLQALDDGKTRTEALIHVGREFIDQMRSDAFGEGTFLEPLGDAMDSLVVKFKEGIDRIKGFFNSLWAGALRGVQAFINAAIADFNDLINAYNRSVGSTFVGQQLGLGQVQTIQPVAFAPPPTATPEAAEKSQVEVRVVNEIPNASVVVDPFKKFGESIKTVVESRAASNLPATP